MYERSAIVLERYYTNVLKFDEKPNLKTNYKNFKDLVEEIEKYQTTLEKEETVIEEFDSIANGIRSIQQEQKKLYKLNIRLEEERNQLFESLDENPALLEKKLQKVQETITNNNDRLEFLKAQFVKYLSIFNEKQQERNICSRERRTEEQQYLNLIEESNKTIEEIGIETLKKLKTFISSEKNIEEQEVTEIMINNGIDEKLPFNRNVIEKAVSARNKIAKKEAECYIMVFDKMRKLLIGINNDEIKIEKNKKAARDISVKLAFLKAEKNYIVSFLDNERMTAINGEKVHNQLMEDACQKFDLDIKQFDNLYELILREITNKSTKKAYKELFNKEYLKNIEEKERNFEKEINNIKIQAGTIINSNYWRIDEIKNIYDVFINEVSEKFEKDLSEYKLETIEETEEVEDGKESIEEILEYEDILDYDDNDALENKDLYEDDEEDEEKIDYIYEGIKEDEINEIYQDMETEEDKIQEIYDEDTDDEEMHEQETKTQEDIEIEEEINKLYEDIKTEEDKLQEMHEDEENDEEVVEEVYEDEESCEEEIEEVYEDEENNEEEIDEIYEDEEIEKNYENANNKNNEEDEEIQIETNKEVKNKKNSEEKQKEEITIKKNNKENKKENSTIKNTNKQENKNDNIIVLGSSKKSKSYNYNYNNTVSNQNNKYKEKDYDEIFGYYDFDEEDNTKSKKNNILDFNEPQEEWLSGNEFLEHNNYNDYNEKYYQNYDNNEDYYDEEYNYAKGNDFNENYSNYIENDDYEEKYNHKSKRELDFGKNRKKKKGKSLKNQILEKISNVMQYDEEDEDDFEYIDDEEDNNYYNYDYDDYDDEADLTNILKKEIKKNADEDDLTKVLKNEIQKSAEEDDYYNDMYESQNYDFNDKKKKNSMGFLDKIFKEKKW